MAKVNTRRLSFTPGGSPDRVGSKLRIVDAGQSVGYDDPAVDIVGDTVNLNLALLMPDADGVYDLYITDVDDAGNESDFLVIPEVTVDFLAPKPPTDGIVE